MADSLALTLAPVLAPVLAAVAAAGFIYSLSGRSGASLSGAEALRHRLSPSAAKRRESLRDLHKGEAGPRRSGAAAGDPNDKRLRAMRATVEKFRMEELLNDSELRQKLARAGYRSRNAVVVFLFFRAVLPLLMGAAALIYFMVLGSAPFDAFRHSAISFGVMLAGYAAPAMFLKNASQKRQKEMSRAYPDALDLIVICVESGMSIEKAFHKVMSEIAPQSPALSDELAILTAELSFLGDRSQAYENLSNRTGLQPVKALTGALIQAERYGTPVAQALRVLSDESRVERMSMAERKAASLPAKLTVPMILFFLPVLFVVIIGPTILQVAKIY